MAEQNIIVLGVDAYKGGWVFVRLENDAFASAKIYASFAVGVGASNDAAVIGVDMPIGFPAALPQGRKADGLARTFVRPLTSTVFPAPHPCVHQAVNWEIANRLSHQQTGNGLSKQSFALIPKILEVQAVAADDDRIYEVHPEVSFRELAGHPLVSKKRWNGHRQRHALLVRAGIVIPDDLGDAGTAAADDILDAAVAAWSASRIARDVASPMPNPPEHDANGRRVAIWY